MENITEIKERLETAITLHGIYENEMNELQEKLAKYNALTALLETLKTVASIDNPCPGSCADCIWDNMNKGDCLHQILRSQLFDFYDVFPEFRAKEKETP